VTRYIKQDASDCVISVHRDGGDGRPACKTRRHEGREWVEVDEDVYPRPFWRMCQNARCFGDGVEAIADGGDGDD